MAIMVRIAGPVQAHEREGADQQADDEDQRVQPARGQARHRGAGAIAANGKAGADQHASDGRGHHQRLRHRHGIGRYHADQAQDPQAESRHDNRREHDLEDGPVGQPELGGQLQRAAEAGVLQDEAEQHAADQAGKGAGGMQGEMKVQHFRLLARCD
jgi:hypothetical protein